jgi:NhaP-type Na+/H+ or K+/H+ antiporter
VWTYLGFAAETLVFLLAGLVIGRRINEELPQPDLYWKIIAGYGLVNVIRFALMSLVWPCMVCCSCPTTNLPQVIVRSYSSLRGAVGLVLALIVFNSTQID